MANKDVLRSWIISAAKYAIGSALSEQGARDLVRPLKFNVSHSALLTLATELAVMISDLPDDQRGKINSALVDDFGMGIGWFTDRSKRRVLKVMSKGVCTAEEFTMLRDFSSDLSNPRELRKAADMAMAEYLARGEEK